MTCRYFTWMYSSSDEDNFLGRTEAKRSNSIEEHNIVDRSLPHIHLLIMGRNGKEVKRSSLRGSDTNFIMIVDIFVSFSQDFAGREHFFTVLKAKGESEGKENLCTFINLYFEMQLIIFIFILRYRTGVRTKEIDCYSRLHYSVAYREFGLQMQDGVTCPAKKSLGGREGQSLDTKIEPTFRVTLVLCTDTINSNSNYNRMIESQLNFPHAATIKVAPNRDRRELFFQLDGGNKMRGGLLRIRLHFFPNFSPTVPNIYKKFN